MARVVTVVLVALIASVFAASVSARKYVGYAKATKGSIGLGHITGGSFHSGAFSIGHGGNSAGHGDGGHGGNIGSMTYGGIGGDSGHTSYA